MACFIKLNIGGLAALGGCWALASTDQNSRWTIWMRRVAPMCLLMAPVLLTRQSWQTMNVVAYLIIGIVAIVCVLLTSDTIPRRTPRNRVNSDRVNSDRVASDRVASDRVASDRATCNPVARHRQAIPSAIAGGVAATVLALSWTIHSGVSPNGIWMGIVGQHLEFATQFWIWPPLPNRWLLVSAFAALTLSWLLRHSQESWPAIVRDILKLAIGCAIVVGALNQWELLPFLIPWAFLLGKRTAVRSEGAAPLGSSQRLSVAVVTVLMYWQAYPVAGTQWTVVAASLVPLGMILLSDALCDLSERMNFKTALAHNSLFATLCIFLCLFVTQMGATASYEYDSLPISRHLQGAQMLRVPESELAIFEGVAWNLKQNGSSLFSLPGMYSFCGWTGLRSTTTSVQTNWTHAFCAEKQRHVIRDLSDDQDVLLLKSESNLEFWKRGVNVANGPAIQFAHEHFLDRVQIGRYAIGTRPSKSFRWIGATVDRDSGSSGSCNLVVQLPVLSESVFAIEAWDTRINQPIHRTVFADGYSDPSVFFCDDDFGPTASNSGLDLRRPQNLTVSVKENARPDKWQSVVVRLYGKHGTVRLRLPIVEVFNSDRTVLIAKDGFSDL